MVGGPKAMEPRDPQEEAVHQQGAEAGMAPLYREEELCSRILATIPDAILRTDLSGTILFANEWSLRFGGYAEEDLVGHNLLSFVAPEDHGLAMTNLRHLIDGLPIRCDYRLLTKAGQRIWFEANGEVLRDDDGKAVGLVFMGRDIDRRKAAEEALRKANEKMAIIGEITRHDALNKLTVLRGCLDLSKLHPEGSEALRYFAKMADVIDALEGQLHFMKEYQEVGVKSAEWQPVRDTCMKAFRQLDLSDVEARVEIESLEILADPMLLKVFYNLADNSLRHGQKVTSISVSLQMGPDGAHIVYEDDGVGIPEADGPVLFSEKHGREHGLFLIKEILRITGIGISYIGRPGEGARFDLHVPCGCFLMEH